MNRTDSSFRRHPGGGSLRRFSFRRKPTRESIPEPTSTWSFNDDNHEWQLLRGKLQSDFVFSFLYRTTISHLYRTRNKHLKYYLNKKFV